MKKCCSISCRKQQKIFSRNPRPLLHYRMEEDEHGKRKLVQCDPVAPSLAEDFSVQSNSLYNRHGGASPVRVSSDLVDIPNNVII